MRDSFHMLDEKLIFSNTPTNKKDYASKRLNYPLEQGSTDAWDKLMSTIYAEEERAKIEWAIGSIVCGESKKLQKFMVLYGAAGTGKSTFLKYICANTKKKHVVLAPTGIAAINAGGSTLHSFFKLPFYPLLPDDPNFSLQRGRIHEFFKYTKPHRKLLEELELVIIDEISMVRADIIDAVDRILRVYSRNLREPFGGKQILLVGDVFQLNPSSREMNGRY